MFTTYRRSAARIAAAGIATGLLAAGAFAGAGSAVADDAATPSSSGATAVLDGIQSDLSDVATVATKDGGTNTREAAGLFKALQGSVEKYGPSMLRNLSGDLLNTMRPVFLSGTGVDFLAKAFNPAFPNIFPGGDGEPIKPALVPDISDWIDEHTVPHGGYW